MAGYLQAAHQITFVKLMRITIKSKQVCNKSGASNSIHAFTWTLGNITNNNPEKLYTLLNENYIHFIFGRVFGMYHNGYSHINCQNHNSEYNIE